MSNRATRPQTKIRTNGETPEYIIDHTVAISHSSRHPQLAATYSEEPSLGAYTGIELQGCRCRTCDGKAAGRGASVKRPWVSVSTPVVTSAECTALTKRTEIASTTIVI